MNLAKSITQQLKSNLSLEKDDLNEQLNNNLRLLSKWRSILIQNTLLEKEGTLVLEGPMKGLDFTAQSSEGCHIAKILGCYEQPLHPYLNDAIKRNYTKILNIGCAEGYYAVGLAAKMAGVISLAFDTDPQARKKCNALAIKNGVDARVRVSGIFKSHNFDNYKNDKILILCDIEGGEDKLLNPAIAPSLLNMDIIVESHECFVKGITKKLISRFEKSHHISLVEDTGLRCLINPPDWFTRLSHLDQLLSTWEWRSGPTPWLVMRARNAG